MRITQINCNYNYLEARILKQPAASFQGNKKDLSRTAEPNLDTYIPLMNNKMKVNENIKFFLCGLDAIDTVTRRDNLPLEIADIGCCDGALCRTLGEFLPENTKYIGLDLDANMLKIAEEKDKKSDRKIDSKYITGNAFDLPLKKDKVDAILASSMVHELYSYEDKEHNEPAYCKESIYNFFRQAYDSLKPGGVLIVKDPATPYPDGLKMLKVCNANKDDGCYLPIENKEELAKADITKLCTLDKLKRFCMDFYPATHIGSHEWKNDECYMPKWLVSEWVRHRKWLATPENWAYEIKENYGVLTPPEVKDFADKIGFEAISIKNIAIPDKNNIYAIREGEFEIKDLENNSVNLESFPMFLEVVLKKPFKN